MSEDEILESLSEIFRETFDRDDLAITKYTSAADIREWDSLNHINIIAASEIRFGIKFKTAELEDLRHVGELVALIHAKLNP